MKSGNLNFLEPAGPLQACNRIALPFCEYYELEKFWQYNLITKKLVQLCGDTEIN